MDEQLPVKLHEMIYSYRLWRSDRLPPTTPKRFVRRRHVSTAKHTLQRGANTCINKNGIRSIKYSVLLLQVCNQTSLTQLRKGLRGASLKLTSISITNGNARCIGKSEF
jgi:hypothetical protein